MRGDINGLSTSYASNGWNTKSALIYKYLWMIYKKSKSIWLRENIKDLEENNYFLTFLFKKNRTCLILTFFLMFLKKIFCIKVREVICGYQFIVFLIVFVGVERKLKFMPC